MAKKNSTLENEFPATNTAAEGTAADTTNTEGTQGDVVDTNLPEGTPAEGTAKEEKTYTMNDGTEGSRAAFIREKFVSDGKSRKEIANEHGFDYRVVYSATVNLTNGSDGGSRGRSPSNSTIQVTEEGKYVKVSTVPTASSVTDPDTQEVTEVTTDVVTVTVNGEVLPEGAEVPATTSISRNDWIVAQVKAGVERGVIAKLLDLSYGVVYGLTKEDGGSKASYKVQLEDGTVISRAEYIRQLFATGKSRSDIAKELEVDYTIVWQATKTEKTEAEKLAEIVETLKAFSDHVTDKAAFDVIVASLATVTFIAPVEETPATETETPAVNAENAPETSVEASADAQ